MSKPFYKVPCVGCNEYVERSHKRMTARCFNCKMVLIRQREAKRRKK